MLQISPSPEQLLLHIAEHEMRTPLTMIKGNVQLAQQIFKLECPQHPHIAEGLACLNRSNEQVDRLIRLIADLLDVVQMDAGVVAIKPVTCDLAEIICESVHHQRHLSPHRTISLHLPPTAVHTKVDPDRLSQVVAHYLTNAVKYSYASSPITVSMQIGNHQAHLYVSDQGPGIRPEMQESIWNPLYRVPDIPVQNGSSLGLGLGLYICRTIIEQHQGRVGVTSVPGKGATFWFSLPCSNF